MTNPVLAWTFTGPAAFTTPPAGANPTIAETIAAIKAHFDAYATKWMVNDYSLANGTLEIKRNPAVGTVTGELASVRILLMGGQTPHANCLIGTHSAGGTTGLYGALSVDAATTGPAASYAAAAPYTTKYTRAGLILTPSTGITTASAPRITLFESDDAFVLDISDNTNWATFTAGRIIERADSSRTLIWGVMPMGGILANASTGSTLGISSAYAVPALTIVSNTIKAAYWDVNSGTARLFGRTHQPMLGIAETGMGSAGNPSAFGVIHVAESSQAVSQTPTFLGTLRQLRWGPIAGNAIKLEVSSVLKGTHVFGGTGSGIGMWLDEAA